MNFEIRGDSANYEVLADAARQIKGVPGLTLEIGVREGFGSYTIMNTLLQQADERPHVGVDPYGNIEYCPDEQRCIRADYTNEMRARSVALSVWASQNRYLYYPITLEDTEYFKRYEDGFPVYNNHKYIENRYALVHFDGPHTETAVIREVDFFKSRTPHNGIWVFDDIRDYNHPHQYILEQGMVQIIETPRKWAYRKVK